MSDEEGFLNRWSRRKLADEPEVTPEPAEAPPVDLPEKSDAEILADLGLKDPDSLLPGDDITGFMAKAVPHHLRNRALRKLWRSNPVLACLDGLNDYDDDFTGDFVKPGTLQTLYKVGRGILKDVPDIEAEAVQEDEIDDSDLDMVALDDGDQNSQILDSDPAQEIHEDLPRQEFEKEAETTDQPYRRRIRVHFEDAS